MKPFEIHTETETDERKPYAWVYNNRLVFSDNGDAVSLSSQGVDPDSAHLNPFAPNVTRRYYEGDTVSFTLNDASEWFN